MTSTANTYRITSLAGQDMGAYPGATPGEALDAMARDAGYADQAAAAAVAGPFDGEVKPEVIVCDYQTGHELRWATLDDCQRALDADKDTGTFETSDGYVAYLEGIAFDGREYDAQALADATGTCVDVDAHGNVYLS